MIRRIYHLISLCIIGSYFTSQSFAQGIDFKKVWSDAEYDMLYDNYPAALQKWLELYAIEPTNANINYKIGLCYLKSNTDKTKAESFLEVATKEISRSYEEFDPSEKKAPALAMYYLAKAYHLESKVDEAINAFNAYKPLVRSNKAEIYKDVDHQIEMCKYAKEKIAHPVELIVEDMGDSVDSKYPDYSPVISADESMIIFTSRREGSTGELLDDEGKYFEDIYVCYRTDSGWTKAVSIGENINTTGHEATINLSADGSQLYIYRGEGEKDGDIYVSTLNGDVWSVPQKLPEPINSKSWETHAALSADGNTLYFVSDRPGGKGGRDIWRVKKLPSGEWSLAENVSSLNTEYDEDGIFIHPDGVHIFFSSQGFKSMGGFDIFSTQLIEDGTFTEPQNLGYPINSTDDDVFFVVSADGRRAYYSSAHEVGIHEKDKGMGEKDIFMLNLVDRELANVTLYKGIIYPGDDLEALHNIHIDVANNNTGAPLHIETRINSKSGKFIIICKPGMDYKITYNMGKYGTHVDTVLVPKNADYREIFREIDLTQPDPFAPKSKAKEFVAMDDTYYTFPETALDMDILTNDICSKGSIASYTITTAPKHGKANVAAANGPINFVPEKGFKGMDDLQYTFKNTTGKQSNIGHVKVFVSNIIAKNDNANTTKNQEVAIKVLANDKIKTGKMDLKSLTLKTKAAHGTVEIDSKGNAKYKPAADYTGSDYFIYAIKDDKGDVSNDARVDILVSEGAVASSGSSCGATSEYQRNFTYNKVQIQKKEKEYADFVNALADCIKKNGSVVLDIESSASKVPTKKFRTNDKLAALRAEAARKDILAALNRRGISADKVKFGKMDKLVQGPEYNNDFIENRATYEKYQYIKIFVK